LKGDSQRGNRSLCGAGGQAHCAARVRSDRAENGDLHSSRDAVELFACGARSLEIANRKQYLHDRRQEARALERLACGLNDTSYCASGRVVLTLRKPQKRQTWIGLPPALTCISIRLFGHGELPAQAVDLRLLVRRIGRDVPLDGCCAASGLYDGLRPSTSEHQELGAIDDAAPAERRELRLPIAPDRERPCPLARAIERVDAVTASDRAAIHDPGYDRRQLPADHREHDFIEQSETLRVLSTPYEDQRLELTRPGDEIGIGKSLTYLYRRGRGNESAIQIARSHVTSGNRNEQIPTGSAIDRLALDYACRARKLSSSARVLAQGEKANAHPECPLGRSRAVPRFAKPVVKPLALLLLLVIAPSEPRSPGKSREVFEVERCIASARTSASTASSHSRRS
jgi:hypothetical protein